MRIHLSGTEENFVLDFEGQAPIYVTSRHLSEITTDDVIVMAHGHVHDMGDVSLVKVAAHLGDKLLTEDDTTLGGDEFWIVDNSEWLYETPIGQTVGRAQDMHKDIYIAGFNSEGTRALVVDVDTDGMYVASVDATNGSLGRWECSRTSPLPDIYVRFPRR